MKVYVGIITGKSDGEVVLVSTTLKGESHIPQVVHDEWIETFYSDEVTGEEEWDELVRGVHQDYLLTFKTSDTTD